MAHSTIFQLRPDAPVECEPQATVYDAAIQMALNRVHCLLVKETGSLVGILTAKDLAYRITAHGRDPQSTLVRTIMTTTPLCLHMDTPITEALETMVKRAVRHLPLVDTEGNIRGVLDITRCFHQAMLRMERIAASAQKLRDVLTEVALDYGDVRTQAAERIVQDVNRMTNLVDVPTLKSVDCKPAVYIASSSTVSDAAMLMVRHSTTALLVLDGTSLIRDVIGIFTTKDICTRVIAKGYDPRSCTVARVLTTSPEFARSDLNVSAALRLMYQGHFLNLPVLDDNSNEIVGVVSVLQLTYAALAQLGKREGFTPDSVQKSTLEEVTSRLTEDSTPVWDTFWNSLDKSNDDIQNLESSVSKTPSRSHSPKSTGRRASLNQMLLSNSRKKSNLQRKFSDDNTTLLSPAPKYRRVQSTESLVRMKFYLKRKTVTFKIKDYATNMTDKISMTINDSVSVLDDLKPFELLHQEIAAKFDMTKKHEILYYDNEGDLIVITDEQDLMESISCFEKQGHSTVELILRPKRYSDGIFSAIWRFFSNITWPSFHTFKSPGFLTGVAVLSIGVLVGTTMKPLRSWP